MIHIHAIFRVNPLKEAAFLEEIQPLIAASRAESGNLSYHLYRSTEDEFTFIMVEAWESHEAIQTHNSSAHFTAFVAKASEFLTAPLDVKLYHAEPLS